jgi:hypothetical protein
MDTEAGKSAKEPEKHDISSYVSPHHGARPSLAASRDMKVKMVSSAEVEGKHTITNVRMDHIVKIFKDDDDFVEGTLCVCCRCGLAWTGRRVMRTLVSSCDSSRATMHC